MFLCYLCILKPHNHLLLKMAKITVQNTNITIINVYGEDYVSITDIARHKSDDPTAVIGNWMRNRNTIEFLGIWESLYNSEFKTL